jgi:tryptophanyl-tRNA synthetase
MKPVLVSGMQPTGRLHIGNYLGALKNFVDVQDSEKYECFFFIVDLHSLTENFDPKEKRAQILNLLADYMAAGLNPKKSVIFLQSHVPAHSELAWILGTLTPMGELERMTQYKDKSSHQVTNINAGLFTYPILMASDILLYNPNVVPVGDDQLQHLELTRTIARKFNTKFGTTFREPRDLTTKTPRVMSLKDPSKKMSKSQPEGCLFLDDTPKDIASKIARAVTDSDNNIVYDREKKPGLSNLLEIYAALTHMDPKLVAEEFRGQNYSALKAKLAEVVTVSFAEFRERKADLISSPKKLIATLNAGSKKAAKVAEKKMKEVREKIGIEL